MDFLEISTLGREQGTMQDSRSTKPARPWRVVAAEITTEPDSQKLAQLIEELNRALEEQGVVKADRLSRPKNA